MSEKSWFYLSFDKNVNEIIRGEIIALTLKEATMRTVFLWVFERSRLVLLLFSFLWGTQDCSLWTASDWSFWARRNRCHSLHLPLALRKRAVFVSRKSGPFAHVANFLSLLSTISSHLQLILCVSQLPIVTVLSKAQIDSDLSHFLMIFVSSIALTVFQSRCHRFWKRHANAVKAYKLDPAALKSPFWTPTFSKCFCQGTSL